MAAAVTSTTFSIKDSLGLKAPPSWFSSLEVAPSDSSDRTRLAEEQQQQQQRL